MSTNVYIAGNGNKIANKVSHSYNDSSAASHTIWMSNNIIGIRGTRIDDTFLSGVQSTTLGTNVLSVANGAFRGCTNLKTFQPNDKLKHIGHNAFYGCTSLCSFSLPDRTRFIGENAFRDCSSVQSIEFSSKSTAFGASAFRGCSSLTAVSVDVKDDSGSHVFRDCPSLAMASVKRTLTTSMFRDDISLKSVSCYFSSLSDVPDSCFQGCSSLTSIYFQKPVQVLGQNCFYGCTSLSTIDLSSMKVKTLPNKFLHGTKVSALSLPTTLDDVRSLTASECSACLCGMTLLSSVAFNGMDDKYMSANKKKFNRFGCGHNFTVYSSNGTRYELSSNGKGLRLSDPEQGSDVTNIYVVSIAHTGGNSLQYMYDDTRRLCEMIEQATDGSGLNVVYKKLNDYGDWQHQQPTLANVQAAINAAKAAQPDMFIFHFSDHGNDSSPTGYMNLANGEQYSYGALYNDLQSFSQSFVVMCCCFPWYGVTQQSNDINALVWCAGQTNTYTWKDSGATGHLFMTAMYENFNKSFSYKQLWSNMEKNGNGKFSYTQTYAGRSWHVVPQQYKYGKFNLNNRVFM